ncbi:Fe-hydrogenase [Cryptosporidium ryanae]|uniref:Fe-hydrogenase n=1 Tax=Cryptosporidium ryanae TaxID=515981 RepID=UPI00351A2623|nr:Fe-hydrogenase [Cryptosporidium ryanae]
MFSTTVKLANLDDYLESAQDCIVSLVSDKDDSKPKIQVMKNSRVEDKKIPSGYVEKATVNLTDCLACSGCVTSSETKLLKSQNIDKFLEKIKEKKLIVVSLSNQSCVSLAVHYNCDLITVQKKLSGLFKSLGVNLVINSTISEYISLLEAREEFIFRLNKEDRSNENNALPLIISHCPGWICYAEKNLDSRVLPLLSRVRSAQQIQGILVKTLTLEIYNQLLFLCKLKTYQYFFRLFLVKLKSIFNGNSNYINELDILHVAIMPCHDKKLESARDSLSLKINGQTVPEVDIVLATEEVNELIKMSGFSFFSELPEAPMDNLWLNQSFTVGEYDNSFLIISKNRYHSSECNFENNWLIPSHFNSGSGGYCEYIIRSLIKKYSNCNIVRPEEELSFNKQKSDIMQGNIKFSNNEINYAFVYGFKAIQSMAKKLCLQKSSKQDSNREKFHLIEVMACPNGCISGGGQILKSQESENSSEVEKFRNSVNVIQKMDRILHDGVNFNEGKGIVLPESIPIVETIFDYLKHIDKVEKEDYCSIPFLRDDFVSFNEKQTLSSLSW